jgi:Dolichyl-phosphate-mannose-protein mannosyltransferase
VARADGDALARASLPPRPAEPTGTARPARRLDLLVAGVIALLTAAVAVVYRSTLVPTDPWHYVEAAKQLSGHEWNAVGLTRYGLIGLYLPLAQAIGAAQLTFYAVPVVSSAVLAGLVYLLGARAFGRAAGVAAAVLLVATPVFLTNMTRGYPDLTATTLIAAAMLTALAARDEAARTTSPAADRPEARPDVAAARPARSRRPRRLTVLLVLVGFLLGWSYEVRETAVFGWPVVIAILWRALPLRRWLLPVALPAAALLLLELAVNQLAYGNALIRLRALTGADLAGTTNPADVGYLGQSRWDYLTLIPRQLLDSTPGGRVTLALIVVAVLGGVLARRRVGVFAAWFLVAFVAFALVGGALRPGHPSIRLDVERYWIFFLPPLVLAAVGAVTVAAQAVGHRIGALGMAGAGRVIAPAALTALVAVALVPAAATARDDPTLAPNGGNALEQLRGYLGSLPEDRVGVVWSDWSTKRILPSYELDPFGGRVWDARLRSLTGPGQPTPGDLVVLFSAHDATCVFCRTALRPWLREHPQLPASWSLQWRTPEGNLFLYRVGPGA